MTAAAPLTKTILFGSVIIALLGGLLFNIAIAAAQTCGDGTIDTGEACDDSATVSGDGCALDCTVEQGWICEAEPSVCGNETGLERLAHRVLLASAPYLVFAAFAAGCWAWPFKRPRH